MKKVLHHILKIGILFLFFFFFFVGIKLIYHIEKEEVDTSYMWNISYLNLQFTEGSKEGKVFLQDNSLAMEVVFEKEEEFYEFQVDMCNNGSMDALITAIHTDIENEDKVLKTELFYLDHQELKQGDLIKSGETKSIRIRISYPKQEKKIYEALEITFSSIS